MQIAKNRYLGTIGQLCLTISSQLKHIFQRLSRLGSVTALHSNIGRQPNFAALNRGRHLCSAGRPSRWALAHILVPYVVRLFPRYIDVLSAFCVITGSIARSATRRYLIYSEADFEGFRPAGATR